MASFNKVVLVGNLTRDPEVKYLPSGSACAEFGIAVSEKFKDKSGQQKEETSFFDVVYFGKTAEVCGQYLKKGSSCLVDGKLKQEQWQDKQTGVNRSKVKVIGQTMQMLGSRGDSGGSSYQQPADSTTAQEIGDAFYGDGAGEEVPF